MRSDSEGSLQVADGPAAAIRDLLEWGVEEFGLQHGYLTRVKPGPGTHVIVATTNPDPQLQTGSTHRLATTFCRHAVVSNEPLAIPDASTEEWRDDPATHAFPIRSYFGTKVLSDNSLYGTVFFAGDSPCAAPFTHSDHALLDQIAQHIGDRLRSSPPLQSSSSSQANVLRRVQEVSRIGGWEIDLPTHTLTWTEQTYQIYELPLSYEPELESALQYFAEEARSSLRTALTRCIEEGIPYDIDLPLITGEGNRRWVRARGIPNRENGRITRVTGTLQDISKRHELEREVHEGRTQFRHLVENAGPIVFMLDADGTILVSQGEDLEAFGQKPGDGVGTSVYDVCKDSPRIHSLVDRVLAGEAVDDFISVGGRLLDVWCAPFHDVKGRVAGCVGMAADVTEKKEMEKSLREERDLMNRVFETSPSAIVILNRDGEFVRVSDRAERILELEKNSITRSSYEDLEWTLTSPDGTPLPDEDLPFARIRQTGECIIGANYAIHWPDRPRRRLSVSGAPLHDQSGTFVGAVFHIDDVTARHEAERNLQESEQRFRGVFENAALGLALLNQEGQILNVNPALESMFGYEAEALRGLHLTQLTHADDGDVDQHVYEELRAGQRDHYQREKRYVRQNGDTFWGHLSVSHLDGPTDEQFIGMVEDIDIRKRQKEELRQFRKVVEQTHEAVLVLDEGPRQTPGPTISYANSAFVSLTGYPVDEIVGAPLQILFGPDTEPWVVRDLWTSLQEGQRHKGEAITYRKDERPFVNRWSIAPVRDDDGTITHWVSVQRDVTEERQMGKQLLEVQDEERRRIDQELHDEMGGLLTTLQMTVDLARLEAQKENAPTDRFDDLEDLVSDVSSVARTISRRLHPKVLDDHGLSKALSSLRNKLQEQHDVTIALHNEITEGERLSSLVELTAFHVVQETLVRIVPHTETTTQVLVNKVNKRLRLHVINNSMGVDTSCTEKTGGIENLQGVVERVERLNGEVDISTSDEEGTRISATLPLTIGRLPD